MRLITCLMLSLQIAVAVTIDIKDGDVEMKVNGEVQNYREGESFISTPGESLCFINGKGRVLIDGKRQLTNKNKNCFIVPVTNDFNVQQYLQSVKDKVYIVFFNSTEKVRHGVSVRNVNTKKGEEIINLTQMQDIVIYSDIFGPPPIYVSIINNKGEVVEKYTILEEKRTLVRFSNILFSSGYFIKVENKFDQILMNKKIIIE